MLTNCPKGQFRTNSSITNWLNSCINLPVGRQVGVIRVPKINQSQSKLNTDKMLILLQKKSPPQYEAVNFLNVQFIYFILTKINLRIIANI